jgi:hypothetical protein
MLHSHTRTSILLGATLLVLQASCSSGGAESTATTSQPVAGSCDYTGTFSGLPECRAFVGEGWSAANVRSECEALGAEPRIGVDCSSVDALGSCTLEVDATAVTVISTYADDSSECDGMQLGCETFGGGSWSPAPVCDGSGGGGLGTDGVFVQPTQVCVPPVAGEQPGNGPNGQVCTWQSIAGCTEEGRHFRDYASCDVVRSQRPYYPTAPAESTGKADPRLNDPAYAAELAWVTQQVQASGCVCCHEAALAPDGPSQWYIDAPGNWVDSMAPSGLALGASWIDSVAFGAYPPEENNGFERETSGFPSTDPQRMRAFFIAELEQRGYAPGDFANADPFGGPLYDQIDHQPTACVDGQGLSADGTLRWTSGSARYLYLLEADSRSPTVPPNLDLPEGTLWRIDVPSDGTPLNSGEVRYGEVPAGALQRFPAQGAPPALTPGTPYYLYVSMDVGIPITRCLFTP